MSAIEKIFEMLSIADGVSVNDGPVVKEWHVEPVTGVGENEVVRIEWTLSDQKHSVILTEGGIADTIFKDNTFILNDHEGDRTLLRFYKTELISID